MKYTVFHRNIFWVLIGNVTTVGSQALLMILLVKKFPENIIGQIALGVAFAEPVLKLFNLNLRVVQATDQAHKFSFNEYYVFRLSTTLIAFILLAGMALAVGEDAQAYLILFLVGLFKCLEAISDIFYGLYQKNEQMRHIGQSRAFKAILALSLVSIVVFLTGNILYALAIQALAPLLVIAIYDYKISDRFFNRSDSITKPHFYIFSEQQRKLLLEGLPLGVTMFWVAFNYNIPRYALGFTTSEKDLGIFAALSYFLVAGQVIIYSFGTVTIPRLAKYYQDGRKKSFTVLLGKLTGVAWLIALSGTCLAWKFGREIITFFYTPEYAQHTVLLLILAITGGFSFSSSLLANGINATRSFRAQLYILPGITLTGIISCGLLIPRIGLLGAGVSALVIAVVQVILRLFLLHRIISHMIPYKAK